MSEQKDITLLRVQREFKPKIEDVIPVYLVGENKEMALEFISYLRENKIKPTWATHNSWKAIYKSKVICYIRLPINESDNYSKQSHVSEWKRHWLVTPHLYNMEKYKEQIINEGLLELIWNNYVYCKPCEPIRKCAPGVNKNIFGKEFNNLCRGVFYDGCAIWINSPDNSEVNGIKKLLEMEKQTRT